MIVVRIEMWPGGDREKAYLLQEMAIANVGGDAEKGDYAAVMSHSTTFKGNGLENPNNPPEHAVWKRARVRGFPRKLSPAELVRRAIYECLGPIKG